MFIPPECIHFPEQWLAGASEQETLADIPVEDIGRIILYTHYRHSVEPGHDPDGLLVLDDLASVLLHLSPENLYRVHHAKELTRAGKITLLDAILVLFTKRQLLSYARCS